MADAFISNLVPVYTSSAEAQQSSWLYTLWILIVHFVLSLHNGWIDPVLSNYRSMYQREARELNQRRAEEERQAAEEAAAPAEAQRDELDDLLFGNEN